MQTTAPNSITTTADKTYSIQVNSSGDLVVNVPWVSGSGASDGDITSVVAGSGLSGGGTTGDVTLNALTASTSASGITTLTNTIDSTQTKALTPKAVNDAGYLTTESDTLQTVTDRGSNTTNSIFTSGNITATSGYFDTFDMTLLGDGSQPPHLEGRLFYDSENHTITMFNDEPDVSLQIGQELYIRVRNETPDDIPNGSVVRLEGSHGNAAPTIVLASADSEENSQVAGFATHTIESNSFGYISTFGLVRGVDTNGGMSDGDELFLSVTSGEYVNADPGIPYYSVSLGRVIVSHESNGSIFVNIGKRKLSGGDLKSVTALNQSGVPFVTYIADTNAGGVTTVSNFVYDSGNSVLYVNNKQVITSGDNVSLLNNDAGYLTAHPAISAASSSDNSGRTYIQDILLDSNGHVTGIATAAETVTDTTYTAGTGLLLSGTEFNVSGVDTSLLQGTISTAQIADNAVTLAKLAGGTDGQIITFDANGDPVAVGPGTDGQVLTSTGPGSPPAFEDASGGAVSAVANGSDNRVVTFSSSDALNGEANLTFDGSALGLVGTFTVGADDTGHDVKFHGATAGSYLEWDESEDRLNLVGGAYVNEAVPANDTPTTEDATVTLDLSLGNYHNIVLGVNVTKFEFTNAKRGQRFILRITQHASSAKTVSWADVDSDTGGTAATVRWAGNITPTMSTATSHTDVYGFLCTNNAGTNFDGFIIGQDIPD
jgi:hypothetical protein